MTTRLRLGALVLSNGFRQLEKFGLSYLIVGEDGQPVLAEIISGR